MSIDQKVFDKKYYLNVCLGSEEFRKSGGLLLHPSVKELIDRLPLTPGMNVLEIGCGRGDIALHIAKKVNSIVATDYSVAAIEIAKQIFHRYPKKIQSKTRFYVSNATQLLFKDDAFDAVIFIDTIDHLSKKEVEIVLGKISKVLKKDGFLFIRTCSNRILLDYVYNYYTYPINRIVTWVDKKIKRVEYASLPKDSRTKDAKRQHINEPDYHYLKQILKIHGFEGEIKAEIGELKEIKGIRSKIYNFAIALYPLSKYYPLKILFASSFVCLLYNRRI